MPITFSGFAQAEAIEVIDKEDVLEANTQVPEVTLSNSLKTDCFTSIFSTIASIIKSHDLKS